ncbi:MAG TPA: aminoacyl-tRNA hydrolase [Anaerolineales bacterium]
MSVPRPNSPSLVVGLANPGREYRRNRHNAGAMVVDRLARTLGKTFQRKVGQALVLEAGRNGRDVILAKPTVYMNESGRSVASLLRSFRLEPEDLLVVCDDLDLPLGRIRLRPEGGSAGHRGLDSVIRALGGRAFARLRVGIGRPPGSTDPVDYVLEDFLEEELPIVDDALERAASTVWLALDQGIVAAMNEFNMPPTLR